jgi:shikimate dehydrogenase
MQFGVIGSPIDHSQSPSLFSSFWAEHSLRQTLTYKKAEVTPESLRHFLSQTQWDGFNATLPIKTALIPHMHALTPSAQAIGAVNTVVRTADGWIGHNTDADGFWEMLCDRSDLDALRGLPVCVLGNGGAARAVAYALATRGFTGLIACRQARGGFPWQEVPFEQAHASAFGLVVQCTSLGMTPNETTSPPFPSWDDHPPLWALDLVYVPKETRFLQKMAALGVSGQSGGNMLRFQAKKAWEYWAEVLNIPHI